MANLSKVQPEVALTLQEQFDQEYKALIEKYQPEVSISGLQVIYKMIKNQEGQPVMVDAEIGGQAQINFKVSEKEIHNGYN